MAEQITDGNISWSGGMDTSVSPDILREDQYFKGVNLIIPDGPAGIEVRPGFKCCQIIFKNKSEEEKYSTGHIQGEGYFISNNQYYLIVVVNGYVFRMFPVAVGRLQAELLNENDRNSIDLKKAWVTQIPGGCIINNGFDYPLYVTSNTQRRTDPSKGEIGIGMMGIYTQFRLFYVDQSGRRIIASDFNQPIKNTEYKIFGNIGFAPPDAEETITAIGKQKLTLNYIEGGNLIFSTNKDIYSVDVRGPRSSWSNINNNVGKVSETIPGFSAVSAYSFETFNANIYFRTNNYGLSDLRQSEFQFTNLDTTTNQSNEAAYFFDNDTDWMLDSCYTRAWNKRLLTTVSPERTEEGYTYWNGILSCRPAYFYKGQTIPKMYESVFTGVRPWCVTSVKQDSQSDILYVHSYDHDGSNRLYMMDGSLDYDINHRGERIEIQGFCETRGYSFRNPFLLKRTERKFMRLAPMERSININVYARPESNGEWIHFYRYGAKICRSIDSDSFAPFNTKPRGIRFLNMPSEKIECAGGSAFVYIQYRIEFKGPIKIDYLALAANVSDPDKTVTQTETECKYNIYSFRPDYSYLISNQTSEEV